MNADKKPAVRADGKPFHWRRAASFLGGFMLGVLLASEVILVVCYAVPALSILMFQYQGISVDRSISVMEFAMGDVIVLAMMWGVPTLTACIMAALAEWRLVKAGCRAIWRMMAYAVAPGAGRKGKGDDGE